jgi:uncharacterized membrane protein YheB (UPF0754 family)
MEIFLTILKYAAGPVIGAVIGYFTNWLAVKMLFRPYYPVKIGKVTLPFTPGIIPKRKGELAKAVGKAVGETLFTGDDLKDALSGDDLREKVADAAVEMFNSAGDKSIDDLLSGMSGDSSAVKQGVQTMLTDKVYSAVQRMDLGQIVADEGAKVVRQKKSSLGMLSMFLTDELICSVTDKLKEGVNGYVQKDGRSLIDGAVNEELSSALKKPLNEFDGVITNDVIRSVARAVYDGVIGKVLSSIVSHIDISAVAEAKINAMDIKDLEKLVLSVMKKELNAIVNLGALIGFVLGIVMIFI